MKIEDVGLWAYIEHHEWVSVDSQDHEPTRWGNRETRIFKAPDGTFWAVGVYVSAGDNGRVEPEGDPYQVVAETVAITRYRRP